jgi:hypothetical protein
MAEETSFKKLKEWINNHTRLTIVDIDSTTIKVTETWGTDNKTSIDLNIHRTDSGKYTCVGYISYLSKYEYIKVDLIEVFKTVKSEEELIKALKSIFLAANDLTNTIYRIESELKDS